MNFLLIEGVFIGGVYVEGADGLPFYLQGKRYRRLEPVTVDHIFPGRVFQAFIDRALYNGRAGPHRRADSAPSQLAFVEGDADLPWIRACQTTRDNRLQVASGGNFVGYPGEGITAKLRGDVARSFEKLLLVGHTYQELVDLTQEGKGSVVPPQLFLDPVVFGEVGVSSHHPQGSALSIAKNHLTAVENPFVRAVFGHDSVLGLVIGDLAVQTSLQFSFDFFQVARKDSRFPLI